MKPKIISRHASLENRLSVILGEVDDFILERAKEIQGEGVPLEVIANLLSAGKCPCHTLFKICDTQRHDAEVAEREGRKAKVRNATA